MKRLFPVLVLALAAITGGCSEIGKINGVDISRISGDNPNASYCQLNPGTCILGAAAVIGGTALIIQHAKKDKKAAQPLPGGS